VERRWDRRAWQFASLGRLARVQGERRHERQARHHLVARITRDGSRYLQPIVVDELEATEHAAGVFRQGDRVEPRELAARSEVERPGPFANARLERAAVGTIARRGIREPHALASSRRGDCGAENAGRSHHGTEHEPSPSAHDAGTIACLVGSPAV